MKFPVVLKSIISFLQLSSGSRRLSSQIPSLGALCPPGIGFDLTSEKPRCGAQKQETLGTSPGWHRACGWQQFLWVPPPNGKLLPLWSPLPLGGSL